MNLPLVQRSDAERHLLVMAVHPKCPCTRASAGELARLIARFHGMLQCVVLVYRPAGESDAWTQTRLVRDLPQEPDTRLISDIDGEQARALGMLTSGAVVLYSPDGEPCYWGGITAARGHEGDNLGSDAIAAILEGQTPTSLAQPVFGCRIHPDFDIGGG